MARGSLPSNLAIAAEACEQIAFESPGSVQPFCGVLVVSNEDHAVRQASDSLRGVAGIESRHALDRPLEEVLGNDAARAITTLAQAESPRPGGTADEAQPRRYTRGVNVTLANGTKVHARANRLSEDRGDAFVVELEAADPDPAASAALVADLMVRLASLGDHHGRAAPYLNDAVAIIRESLGYDRVVALSFDQDGNGEVTAEACADSSEPLLGLHFPFTDIPQRARRMLLREPLRYVPDLFAEPSPLRPELDPKTGRPVDLSMLQGRAMAEHCVQFRQNMGLASTMVAPVAVRGSLHAMLSCHHRTPRPLPPAVRDGFAAAGVLVSRAVEMLLQRERDRAAEYAERVADLLDDADTASALLDALMACEDLLLKAMDASGLAVVTSGEVARAGQTPSEAECVAIARQLETASIGARVDTDCIRDDFPDIAELAPDAAGFVHSRLSDRGHECLLWFRPEQVREVRWAGDPSQAIVRSENALSLSPRTSFADWQRLARNRSAPWEPHQLVIAHACAEQVRSKLWELRARTETQQQATAAPHPDFRSPLLELLGFAANVGKSDSDNHRHELLARIRSSGEHLLQLIDDLSSDNAETHSGKDRPDAIEQIQLEPLLAACMRAVEQRANRRRVKLSFRHTGELNSAFVTDHKCLQHAVMSVLAAAVRHAAGEALIVSARCHSDHPRRELRITVIDADAKLRPDAVAHALQALSRPTPTSPGGLGAGIGLAVGRRAARILGGDLTVTAETGGGIALNLRIPETKA